jgi:UDP-N-acetylmuramoyl-tripeptide--D-alanyl-D-alanine ligase
LKLGKAIQYMFAERAEGIRSLLDPEAMDVARFSIDSRDVQEGDVFFALSQPEYRNHGFNGDFEDATRYVPDAFERGALAAVVRYDRLEEHQALLEPYLRRLLLVDDVIGTIQRFAQSVFLDWDKPVAAITGSAGKTTAKELTAHILESDNRRVLKNEKNFNNGLGHPLTVLKLVADSNYDLAVLEMAMSSPMHEIAKLCEITPPDVAVVLNVLPVHIEHLGTIEAIRAAKAEIVQGMKPGGAAILNADDPRVASMVEFSRGETLTFGIRNRADISARDIEFSGFGKTRFRLTVPGSTAKVSFPLNGIHNVMNALAAAAVAHCFGLSAEAIAESLATAEPPPQRGEVIRFAEGFTIINDSYNSNPDALISMTRTLIEGSPDARRRIVVAGEMLELGDESRKMHFETGKSLADAGIDVLIAVRGDAEQLAEGARTAGKADVIFAPDADSAAPILSAMLREGDAVLVKGSRGVRCEKIIHYIAERFETLNENPQ